MGGASPARGGASAAFHSHPPPGCGAAKPSPQAGVVPAGCGPAPGRHCKALWGCVSSALALSFLCRAGRRGRPDRVTPD